MVLEVDEISTNSLFIITYELELIARLQVFRRWLVVGEISSSVLHRVILKMILNLKFMVKWRVWNDWFLISLGGL